jgi:hypothetical protein
VDTPLEAEENENYNVPTINQLIRQARVKKRFKVKARALDGNLAQPQGFAISGEPAQFGRDIQSACHVDSAWP